jgi:hypothetical protein
MTPEQVEKLRGIRAEQYATRERLLTGNMTMAERKAEQDHLVELTRQALEVEESAAPKAPPPVSDAGKITPEEAGKRAATIRARPEFWKPDNTFDKDGKPAITRQEHEKLKAELLEYDARSRETADGGDQ